MDNGDFENFQAGVKAAVELHKSFPSASLLDLLPLGRGLPFSIAPTNTQWHGRFVPPAPVKHTGSAALNVPGAATQAFAPVAFLQAMNDASPDSPLSPKRRGGLARFASYGGLKTTTGLADILRLAPKNPGTMFWPATAGHDGGGVAGLAPAGRRSGFAAAPAHSGRRDTADMLLLGACAMGGGLPSVAPVRDRPAEADYLEPPAARYQNMPYTAAKNMEQPQLQGRGAIDERQLSTALNALLDRQGRLPPSGATGFDPRLTPAWSGLQLPA